MSQRLLNLSTTTRDRDHNPIFTCFSTTDQTLIMDVGDAEKRSERSPPKNEKLLFFTRLFWLDALQRSRREQTSSTERLSSARGSVGLVRQTDRG